MFLAPGVIFRTGIDYSGGVNGQVWLEPCSIAGYWRWDFTVPHYIILRCRSYIQPDSVCFSLPEYIRMIQCECITSVRTACSLTPELIVSNHLHCSEFFIGSLSGVHRLAARFLGQLLQTYNMLSSELQVKKYIISQLPVPEYNFQETLESKPGQISQVS